MNWIDEIVDQHRELESPLSFWFWGGLSSISATVKDQVWLDRQIYNLYPNIYVMLHADSGMKKGPPIAMARRLVSTVNNTKIISGRSSIQGILKDLGSGQGYSQPGGKVVKNDKSVAFICSSELSSSIVEDKVATKILTDLYDRQYNLGEWRSLLKMETFTLKDPTITMFTATNEAMTEDFFTKAAIQGGYFARTFIIYEKEENAINSLSVPLSNPPDYVHSANYLKQLSVLKGPFQALGSRTQSDIFPHPFENKKTGKIEYFSNAGIIYEEWYYQFKENIKTMQTKDDTGTLNRFGDSVLKVAMLLSLARSTSLIIDGPTMEEAITQCEKLLGNVKQTTLGSKGKSESKSLKTQILMELYGRNPHQITRTMLMNKMWTEYGSVAEFDDILNALEQAGLVRFDTIGNAVIIIMPNEQVANMHKMFSGKQR